MVVVMSLHSRERRRRTYAVVCRGFWCLDKREIHRIAGYILFCHERCTTIFFAGSSRVYIIVAGFSRRVRLLSSPAGFSLGDSRVEFGTTMVLWL